jgi:hypothetical protein
MYAYTSVEFTSDEVDLQDAELLPDREALSTVDVGNFLGTHFNLQAATASNNAGIVLGNSTQVAIASVS